MLLKIQVKKKGRKKKENPSKVFQKCVHIFLTLVHSQAKVFYMQITSQFYEEVICVHYLVIILY